MRDWSAYCIDLQLIENILNNTKKIFKCKKEFKILSLKNNFESLSNEISIKYNLLIDKNRNYVYFNLINGYLDLILNSAK